MYDLNQWKIFFQPKERDWSEKEINAGKVKTKKFEGHLKLKIVLTNNLHYAETILQSILILFECILLFLNFCFNI